MDFAEYCVKISQIMNRMKSFFPKDDEWVGFSPNARTKFLIDKGEMEILFDFAENHEFSEEYRIRIEPTHHRRDMANVKIVRWWNEDGVIYYQRPGLLFEDISYLFIERLLINILEAVKEKNLYHFRLIASVGGWNDVSIQELIDAGFSEKEGWDFDE